LGAKNKAIDLVKKYCNQSLEVSGLIGAQIKKLHNALISNEDPLYTKEVVESKKYLMDYTEKLNVLIDIIQDNLARKSKGAFYTSPKVMSILIDIKDIIERFRLDFITENIKIQQVHQGLHMQQIIYNRSKEGYDFYFVDFDGDPQLKIKERSDKFPIEKDLGTFLRSLSYIKFNTLLEFIRKNIVDQDKFEVPEEFLYNLYFRKSSKISIKHKILEEVLKLLNVWENSLLKKIFDENLKLHFTLINYFTIDRALKDLDYELIFRPKNTLIPIIGLKEIIDKY
jgi:predicted trehalose synthase